MNSIILEVRAVRSSDTDRILLLSSAVFDKQILVLRNFTLATAI